MILVTVGTNEQPFDRLVASARTLADNVDERVIVQFGSSSLQHGRGGEWIDFLPFDALAGLCSEARIVVCHAGVGSIMLARRYGHRPVVMPRRHHRDEAVDDHQVTLGVRLQESGLVHLVEDEAELLSAVNSGLEHQPAGSQPSLPGAHELSMEIRSVLGAFGTAQVGVTSASRSL